MKYLNLLLLILTSFSLNCVPMYSYTQQKIENSSRLEPGMSKNDVKRIMGVPAKTEFSDNFSAWHYCRTGTGSDEFVVVIFENDRVREAKNYIVTTAEVGGATGDCSKFARTVDFDRYHRSTSNFKSSNIQKAGTAWLLNSGYVVTNQHVISGGKSYVLIDRDNREISLELIAQDRNNDIALLWSKELSNRKGIPIYNGKMGVGSDVFTIGYPHTNILGSSPKLSVGIINSKTGFLDDPRTYQISVPLQSGNSGGPLINEYGYAIGIVTSKLDAIKIFMWTGDLPENVNYSVKISYLCLLLNEYTQINCYKTQKEEKYSITELNQKLKPMVFQIISRSN